MYWWKVAAVLALALLLRCGVLWKFGGALTEDRDNYRRIAGHIAAGDGFVDPQTVMPTAYRPPLYPLLLAAVLRCGGGTTAIGIVQVMLAIVTVALTIACGRKLALAQAGADAANFDAANFDPVNFDLASADRISLAAGVLVACDPLLLYQTALVMTETVAALLATLLIWMSLRRPTPRSNFCLGLVLGLACLCRPTFWAFGALSAAIWGLRWLGRRTPAPNDSLLTAGSLVAGLALVVAPWVIRNAVVMGRPIFTTTHGGYTLLLAHNPAYTRAVVEQPWGAVWEGEQQADWVAAIEAKMTQENPPIDAAHLSPVVELARDRWMSQTAWQYIRGEPVVAVKTALTLLGRMWNVVPLATNERSSRSAAVRLTIGTFYLGLFLAVCVGVSRHRRASWSAWRPALVLIVSFTAVHSLYWADMRMRTPLVPAIALLAATCFSTRSPRRSSAQQFTPRGG